MSTGALDVDCKTGHLAGDHSHDRLVISRPELQRSQSGGLPGCLSGSFKADDRGAAHRLTCLDLFCGAGGASMGISRAGFDVTGVDNRPQKNYPFKFIEGDALEQDLSGFDFVWASPPCQAHTTLRHRTGKEYECFIERTRAKLIAWGGAWIIENVMGAPLRDPVRLCGSAFGLNVRRHRIFESNVPLRGVSCCHEEQPEPIDVTGTGGRRKGTRLDGKGGNSRKPLNLQQAQDVMGMPWASRREISQAIPPAYSQFLAEQVVELRLREPVRLRTGGPSRSGAAQGYNVRMSDCDKK